MRSDRTFTYVHYPQVFDDSETVDIGKSGRDDDLLNINWRIFLNFEFLSFNLMTYE